MAELDQFVPVKHLARELGMDRSHARRYVLQLGVVPQKRRTADSGSQLTLTITAQEAEYVRNTRREEGFGSDGKAVDTSVGVFYVVQLVPELDPNRVKLGFAEGVVGRLAQHRTAAPTAKILKTWPCKRSWEQTVIDALANASCRLILNEVYECCDIEKLLALGDQLFQLLPDPQKRPELSDMSPHNT